MDFDYKKKRQGKVTDDEIKQALEKFDETKDITEQSMFNLLESDVRISFLLVLHQTLPFNLFHVKPFKHIMASHVHLCVGVCWLFCFFFSYVVSPLMAVPGNLDILHFSTSQPSSAVLACNPVGSISLP